MRVIGGILVLFNVYKLHSSYIRHEIIRGGPLDILGGGVSDPKKKFMQGIELEKKIPASAWRKKKNSCNFMG